TQNFATHIMDLGFYVRHHSFGSIKDSNTQTVQYEWHMLYTSILPKTGLTSAFQSTDCRYFSNREVLERDFDRTMNFTVLKLVICNVPFVEKHFRNFLFQVRCRNFNNPVVGLNGIPYSGKVIRYWICSHLLSIVVMVSPAPCKRPFTG